MRQHLPRGQPQDNSTLYIGDFSKAKLKQLYEILDRELGIRLGADSKVLTRKIIEVELYSWVELLEKSAKKMEPELNKVLTAPQQRKNDLKRSSFILWSG